MDCTGQFHHDQNIKNSRFQATFVYSAFICKDCTGQLHHEIKFKPIQVSSNEHVDQFIFYEFTNLFKDNHIVYCP